MMKKNVYLTLPNLMSFFRIALSPFFVLALSYGQSHKAAIILLLGWVSDADGWVARKLNQVSELGKNLDYIADGLFLTILMIGSAYYGYVPIGVFILATVIGMLRGVGIGLHGKKYRRSLWNKLSPQALYIYLLMVFLWPQPIIETVLFFIFAFNCLTIFVQGLRARSRSR